jgi:hypothetical protein
MMKHEDSEIFDLYDDNDEEEDNDGPERRKDPKCSFFGDTMPVWGKTCDFGKNAKNDKVHNTHKVFLKNPHRYLQLDTLVCARPYLSSRKSKLPAWRVAEGIEQ